MKKLLCIIATMLAFAGIVSSTACSGNTKSQEQTDENKMAVCYFSATGTTAAQAKRIAELTGADLYEIVPETIYTSADLDWTDSLSRSTIEMKDLTSRPALKDSTVDFTGYDIVFIGYPNWWNTAPRIINTFIEAANLDGKTVTTFMTSGSGDIANSEKDLSAAYPAINWKKGLLMNNVTDDQIKDWHNTLSE